jgi:hypothetical protein
MKGFELRIYDMNNNQVYKELFTSYQTKRDDVERKAKQIMDNSENISPKKNLKPASFKIYER